MTGIAPAEFEARHDRARHLMRAEGLDALLITTQTDFCYFTGFLTRFWESPTRPWYLILPSEGPSIAVIPVIGRALMERCAVGDIRTWQSPAPSDEGITLLQDTLSRFGRDARIGVPDGSETRLGFPLGDWQRLTDGPFAFTGDAGIVARLRQKKSQAEIALIASACAVGDRAFARVPEIAGAGIPLDEVFRRFQMLCLEEGADWVSYLAGASGPGGYADVISPAGPRPLATGDVLMLDTGAVREGYFCDFDRNFSVGVPSAETVEAHRTLIAAIDAAAPLCRPGLGTADLFAAMDEVLTGGAGGADVGRYGHGLGLNLTEGPSIMPSDPTRLETDMVLTLEPSLTLGPERLMVHEENVVVTTDGARFLTRRAGPDLMVL